MTWRMGLWERCLHRRQKMKALILHLSDIHFEKRGDVSKENIKSI